VKIRNVQANVNTQEKTVGTLITRLLSVTLRTVNEPSTTTDSDKIALSADITVLQDKHALIGMLHKLNKCHWNLLTGVFHCRIWYFATRVIANLEAGV
jgi:hypothetical protein